MSRRISLKQRIGIGGVAILTLLTVTALPGLTAPTGTKYFTSSVASTTTVNAGDLDEVFLVTIRNTSPKQSSSNIGSVSVIVPDELTVVSARVHESSTNGDNSGAVVTVDSQGTTCNAGTAQQVNACNIAQVKSQKTIVLEIHTDVTSSGLACGANTSGAWLVRANTGTQLNGDEFVRDPAQTADPTTTITNTCTLAFDPAPVDSAVGADIPVGVKVLDGSSNEITTGRTVTLSIPGATVNGSPDSASDGEWPFEFTVSGSSAGPYTATASSTGFTSIAASFTLYDPASSISGQKWRDHNNNGLRDDDERGLADWTIGAYQGGVLVNSATTAADDPGTEGVDESGTYTITGLSAGETYTVCEIAPDEDLGYEYRGWFQSVPTGALSEDLCAEIEGAEPNGYTVTFPDGDGTSESGKDFFNVRTITIPEDVNTEEIDCGNLPEGGVFTVGDGVTEPVGTITVDPDTCKPGEYVFETWFDANTGEQNVAFYPIDPASTSFTMPVTEFYEWLIDDDRTQHTLVYDDFAPFTDFRPMLFCDFDGDGNIVMPVDPDDPDVHTSCLLETSEVATASGVERTDRIYSFVDGQRKI
jgi:hypothetical protein